MPIPKPQSSESKKKFIQRCMGNNVMVKEFPDTSQRRAVCETQWSKKRHRDFGLKENL